MDTGSELVRKIPEDIISMLQEKGGGHTSNPLQLRIVSIFYGEHSISPEVTFEVCLKP